MNAPPVHTIAPRHIGEWVEHFRRTLAEIPHHIIDVHVEGTGVLYDVQHDPDSSLVGRRGLALVLVSAGNGEHPMKCLRHADASHRDDDDCWMVRAYDVSRDPSIDCGKP
jgi:hypothetical protein